MEKNNGFHLNVGVNASKQQTALKSFLRQTFVVLGVALNVTSIGCAIGYPAILLPQLQSHDSSIQVSRTSQSWIASILGLAITNGNLMVPLILDRFGRKLTNQISTLPIIAGWGFIIAADSVPLMLLGRYLQGFGMGIQAPVGPVSIGEYTSPKNRGAFLGTISLSLASGMLIIHAIGTFQTWKTTAIICSVFSILALIIMTLSPESPAWLASKGKYEKCRTAFTWLRGTDEQSMKELEIMISTQVAAKKFAVENKKPLTVIGFFKILIKKEFFKPLLIMFFLYFLFQFSGTNVIPSYTVRIMEAIMGDHDHAYTGMIVIDIVRFLTSVLACFVVRRFKRRFTLFLSAITTMIFLIATSLYMFLRDIGYIHLEHNWIPVITTLIYIFALFIGISSIPWAIAGEIFPLEYKSILSALSGIFVSSLLFASVQSAPYMFDAIGVDGAFGVYALCTFISIVILHFLLPETKGKTLQEIENYFKGVSVKDEPERNKMITDDVEGNER